MAKPPALTHEPGRGRGRLADSPMLRWLWNNLGSLVLAFALALAVWIVAVTNNDPTETRELSPVPIEYVGLRQGLLIVGDPPPSTGSLTVRAPLSVWEQIDPEDLHLQVDLGGLEEGDHQPEVQASIDVQPAQVPERSPEMVNLTLERAATASVDIEVITLGEAQLGYRTTSATTSPGQSVVLGPLSQVERVSSVIAEVNVADRRENFNQEVALQPIDSDGNNVSGLELDPESAQVSVAIEPRERFRLVSVVPNFEGEEQLSEAGYRLTDVSVTPEVVTVFSSDPSALENLAGFVFTSPLNLSQATGDLERRLALDLPQGISPVEDQGVLVKVSISPVEGTITVARPVEMQGLEDRLFAVLSPESVEIILNGPLPTLNSLQVEDVRVIVDLLDLGLGTHQVSPLIIIALTDVEHDPAFPTTIEVTITLAPPPNPTPGP